MHDHPTEAWPRVQLRHHPDGNAPGPGGGGGTAPDRETRLSLADLSHVADPTIVTPPPPSRPVPQRTTPAPRIQPPGGYTHHREAVETVAAHVAANRIRRIGPGGLWGWKPINGPSLAEVAAARQKIAEEEERRKLAHIRHLDRLEITRAYLGIFALVLLVFLIAFMAYVAFGVVFGWYVWAPTRVH